MCYNSKIKMLVTIGTTLRQHKFHTTIAQIKLIVRNAFDSRSLCVADRTIFSIATDRVEIFT